MHSTNSFRRAVVMAAASVTVTIGTAGAALADVTPPPSPSPSGAIVTTLPVPDTAPSTTAPTTSLPPSTVAPTTTTGPAPMSTTSTVVSTTTNPPAAVATTLPPAPPSMVSLLAATPPSAPRSPVAKPGNTTVKLTWLAPSSSGGAPIIKYAVQQWTAAEGWKNIAFPAGASYTVVNLVNGKQYVFRIAAHNAAGWSPASTTVTAVPRTVPSAPRSPVAKPGNTTVKLTWLAPSSSGGAPITKYAVQQWTAAEGWKNIASPAGASYTVANLVNGTQYVFRIVAHNAAGWSPASTTVTAVPRTVPSAPLQCEAFNMGGDPHTLVVTWHPPASDGGAPIDFGEVHVIQNGVFVEGAWSDTGLVVTSLPYGAYEVRVRSYNAAGAGPWCITGIWLFP